MLNIALIHQQQVVHPLVDDVQWDSPRRSHCNAFGNGAGALDVVRALDGVEHGRKPHGLHAHHFDAGPQRLGHRGHAGNQTAAANGDDQCVEVRHLLQHLQRDRALARHNVFVIVGMDKGQAALVRECKCVGAGLFQRVPVQNDFSAKATGALHFDAWREARHHDDGVQAQTLRVVGHTLGMVARAHGDHTLCRLFGRQQSEFVAGAPLFEGGRELQVLKLQKDLGPGDIGQGFGGHAGGPQQVTLQPPRRSKNVVEFNHAAIVQLFIEGRCPDRLLPLNKAGYCLKIQVRAARGTAFCPATRRLY